MLWPDARNALIEDTDVSRDDARACIGPAKRRGIVYHNHQRRDRAERADELLTARPKTLGYDARADHLIVAGAAPTNFTNVACSSHAGRRSAPGLSSRSQVASAGISGYAPSAARSQQAPWSSLHRLSTPAF